MSTQRLSRCPSVCPLRFRYTFELYLTSEKLYQFGLETADVLHSWTRSIGKVWTSDALTFVPLCVLFCSSFLCDIFILHQAATPLSCHCLLTREFERVGLLRYRAMLDPQQWKEAFFVLQKSNLFICPRNDGAAEDIINLNRLQELSESWSRSTNIPGLVGLIEIKTVSLFEGVASETENHEKKDILVLVEKGR